MRKPSIRTEKDYGIIVSYYANTPMAQLLEMLPHRNKRWIYCAAYWAGVKRNRDVERRKIAPKRQRPIKQPSREDEVIKENYANKPMAQLLEMLPGRDTEWVRHRAQKLRVKRDKGFLRQEAIERAKRTRKDLWTPEEEAELARKWPILGGETSIINRAFEAIEKRAYIIRVHVNLQIRRIKKHPIWIFNAPSKANVIDDINTM